MYEVNILVNGSRCKQYNFEGKTFIESKHGSEYVIEVKNNSWNRILSVCTVDGLDILSGKPGKEEGPGYVINGYNSGKFDGFRVSDEKVAKFVFESKDKSYAASKMDGSEKNVGVIGVRLFSEKIKPLSTKIYTTTWTTSNPLDNATVYGTLQNPRSRLYDIDDGCVTCDCDMDVVEYDRSIKTYSCNVGSKISAPKKLSCFDMGTKYGEAKESKTVEVEFERDFLICSKDIYYASRQSLIDMGIPLGNEKQVNFPKSFQESKYSTPPEGWNG